MRSDRLFLRLALGVAAWAAPPAAADLPHRIREQEIMLLRVDLLEVRSGETSRLGSHVIEVRPGSAGTLEVDLPWAERARLRVEARARTGGPDGGRRLSVRAAVVLGGQEVRSGRTLDMRDGSTQLLDVLDHDGRRLVLALAADTEMRPVLASPTAVELATPVRLRLEIERIEGDRTVPLESNDLSTFVGQPVEYAFDRGQGSEAVRVRMLPLSVQGDVVELEIEVTGKLPGDGDPLLLSRREIILSSRDAVSSVTVTHGDRPSGYRFLITARF